MKSIKRDDGLDRRLALRALFDRASDRHGITGWQLLSEPCHLWRELIDDCLRLHAIKGACFERDRRKPRAPPYRWLLDVVAQVGDGPERDGSAAQPDQLQVAERINRCAFHSRRAAHDIDQVNAVPHLRDRRAVQHAVQGRGNIFRADAKLARLVLQHVHLDDPRGLHPVEHDVVEARIGSYDPGQPLGEFFDFGDVGSAQPVLHRTSDRRADLEQFHVGVRTGKRSLQIRFKLRLETVPRRNAALANDNHLTKPRVGRLQIERQDKPRSASPDIGRPMVDVLISLELFALKLPDLRIGFGDRGVLWQGPVDDEFAAVRRWKELLLHEFHAEQGKEECSDRHPDRDPAVMHAGAKKASEQLPNTPLSFMVGFHLSRQDRDAKQWCKEHRDNPRHDQGDRDHDEQSKRELAGVAAVEADRNEPGHGNQGPGQHGKGGDACRRRSRPSPRGRPPPAAPPSSRQRSSRRRPEDQAQ